MFDAGWSKERTLDNLVGRGRKKSYLRIEGECQGGSRMHRAAQAVVARRLVMVTTLRRCLCRCVAFVGLQDIARDDLRDHKGQHAYGRTPDCPGEDPHTLIFTQIARNGGVCEQNRPRAASPLFMCATSQHAGIYRIGMITR